jgi:hypothetical protein
MLITAAPAAATRRGPFGVFSARTGKLVPKDAFVVASALVRSEELGTRAVESRIACWQRAAVAHARPEQPGRR